MKNFIKLSIIFTTITLIFSGCSKDEDPVAQIECNTFDEGKNVILDAEEKDMKCVYGEGRYRLIEDSFGKNGESIEFEIDGDFIVTFTTYEVITEGNNTVIESNGVFEVGTSYEAEARTGNATFFSPATLEISSIDKENELISGKITSEAPIRWFEGTPVMGYAIFTFTDFKIRNVQL